jgi:hypothetical protein
MNLVNAGAAPDKLPRDSAAPVKLMTLASSAVPCPRCQKPLTDPDGLGWCQACGFCQSLEEGKSNVPLPEVPKPAVGPSQGGMFELLVLITRLPSWWWTLLTGMALFALVSYVTGKHVAMTTFERALWCTIQIGAGLAMILLAQFMALVCLAPEDEKLSTKDALLSGRLWQLVFQRMPRMRLPVWLAGWGLAVIVSAIFFVGGLSHWMDYLPGAKPKGSSPAHMRR